MAPTAERPIIGVTCESPECADSIGRSGGEPFVLAQDRGLSPQDTLARVTGLLVCAAVELDVATGQARETLDVILLKAALEADMPVLCVGPGMHALNLALGGKLAKGVSGHDGSERDGERVSSFHRIYISPGSKLAAILGSGGFVRVNSRHRQGLKEARKSPRLMASAYSLEDGVIEALESPEHRLVIGVQFDPEKRRELPPHFGRLFQSLVERAKEDANAAKSD